MLEQDTFEFIESLLKLAAIASPQARLLPLFVLAGGIIASAPATGWKSAVAFDFSGFAQLAP